MSNGVATVTAVVGLGLATYKTIDENNKKKKAAKALEKLQQPELKNVAENLRVSTIGADTQRQEQGRLASSQMETLRGAGTRGIFGGASMVESGNQKVSANIAANLDEQQKNIDKMVAEDNQNIRNIREDRHNANVSALSSQYNAANVGQQQGMANMMQSAAMAGQAYAAGQEGTTEGQRATEEAVTPTTYGVTNPGLKANTGTIQQQPIVSNANPMGSGFNGAYGNIRYDANGNRIN